MNNYEEIQFEERNEYAAVTWGVIYGLYSIVLAFIFKIESSILADPGDVFGYGLFTITALLYILNWVLRIAVTVWIVKIAKRLNRPEIVWGFFCFIFPPITLIILGFQDYKIKDKNIEKIVEKARLDFNAELFHIKATQDISEEELKQLEIKLKERFKSYLKKSIQELSSNEGKINGKKSGPDVVETQNIVEVDENELFQSLSNQNPIEDINKCPACGAVIGEKAVVCNECGLTIK